MRIALAQILRGADPATNLERSRATPPTLRAGGELVVVPEARL